MGALSQCVELEESKMCCHRNTCRWRVCGRCGRERRLADVGEVMSWHNRWDPATWRMVPCGGSGRPPQISPAEPGETSLARVTPGTVPGLASAGRPRGTGGPERSARCHGTDPANSSRCACGYAYPEYCRGGHPILPAATYEAITGKAAAGVPFTRIAAEVGMSLHVVRQVVHG